VILILLSSFLLVWCHRPPNRPLALPLNLTFILIVLLILLLVNLPYTNIPCHKPCVFIPSLIFFIFIQSLMLFIEGIRRSPRLMFILGNRFILCVEGLLVLIDANPPSWRTTPFRLSLVAYSLYSQLPSTSGGRSFISNLRTCHAVVIGTCLTSTSGGTQQINKKVEYHHCHRWQCLSHSRLFPFCTAETACHK
jgi:hypothetical protein